MYMKRILYFILPLLILCCCVKHENEFDELGTIDSLFLNYSSDKKEAKIMVMVKDSAILNAISNGLKHTVRYEHDDFVKVPACCGYITLFSKGDSIKYHMRGNLLTHDESYLYLWPNLTDILDSLVLKSDSI